MQARLGHDFSRVRVHKDSRAAASAQAVDALAYTVEQHVVFAAGRFAPQTQSGSRLLAHELAHVIQQAETPDRGIQGLKLGSVDDPAEREADEMAERGLGVGGRAALTSVGERKLHRTPTFSPECDSYKRCEIVEPLVHARQLADAAIAALVPVASGVVVSGRIIDLLNVHFHKDPDWDANLILERFRAGRRELDASLRFNCFESDPPQCISAEGPAGAATNCSAGGDVDICRRYWESSCEDQGRMLLHEIMHHVPGMCTDHAYVHWGTYMTLDSASAMANPDTYSQFAKMVLLGAPSCRDCSKAIQLEGRRY
jgi:Domain of unknown function (DUF4157)